MTLWDIATTILPLILVLGLLYAALLFVRKSGFTVGKNNSRIAPIKVISTQAIMQKKFVSIVKVEDSYLVLGISENSINLLKELDSVKEIGKEDDENKNRTSKKSFKEVMKENLGMK